MKIGLDQFLNVLQLDELTGRHTGKWIYQQVFSSIKNAIMEGKIPHGSILPPTRKVAEATGFSRSTVVTAYDLLRLERLVESQIGSGVRVVYEKNIPLESQSSNNALKDQLSDLAQSFYQNVHRVNVLDPRQVAFRPGLPPVDVFPIAIWKRLVNQFWQLVRARDLSYYPENGIENLRNTLADYLRLTRGMPCHKDQIMIVGGSLQSLYLIGSLLINPGDQVVMENPTFPNVHSLFSGLRAKILPARSDNKGLTLEPLRKISLDKTKLLHLTPSCQYPMGIQMPYSRRQDIVELAEKHNFFIVENDYEHEINGMKYGLKTIFSEDRNDRTFYLGTFNRILHPSIRLGYMVVPRHMISPLRAIARHSHLMVSISTQMVLDEFIQRDHLHKHVRRVNEIAAERKYLFEKFMSNIHSNHLTHINQNILSLHSLYELNKKSADKDFVKRFQEKKVVAHQLSKCYVESPEKQGLIFGYSCANPTGIEKNIHKLERILTR